MKISKNKNFKDEYCASIVKIGEIYPIEGRDRIAKTFVNGMSIVIGKNEFKTGDVAVYVANECVLPMMFLYKNNMFEDKEMNEDKSVKGYINNKCRIRVVKLGGIPSYGILLNSNSIANYLNEPEHEITDFLRQHIGEDFDEINKERFCQVYIPAPKGGKYSKSNKDQKTKRLKRFKMLIEGSFRFHYDTKGLEKYIECINPDDELDISVKIHGTSAIFANILTNLPTPWYKRLWRKIVRENEYDQKYNIVYSSRTVIKNQYINKKQIPGGYYSDDLWGYWAEKLKDFIPKDYCLYCEIVGYTTKGAHIQKGYDYGCNPNNPEKSRIMIYRITENGKEKEIPEVIAFGNKLKETFGNLIIEFPVLYHGTLADLYPELKSSTHWNEDIIQALKTRKEWYMDEDEPMCNNKVPREGIVIRKCNDPIAEAWKLKCDKFRFREAKQVDDGEIDIEMENNYVE